MKKGEDHMAVADIYTRLRDLLPYETLLNLFELRQSQFDSMYLELEALAKAHYELREGDELDEVLALIERLPVGISMPDPPKLAADVPLDSLTPVPFEQPADGYCVPDAYHVAGKFAGSVWPDYPVVIHADSEQVVLEVHDFVQGLELPMAPARRQSWAGTLSLRPKPVNAPQSTKPTQPINGKEPTYGNQTEPVRNHRTAPGAGR
jgi:hypothetical protein